MGKKKIAAEDFKTKAVLRGFFAALESVRGGDYLADEIRDANDGDLDWLAEKFVSGYLG